MSEVTRILEQIGAGEEDAAAQLLPIVYDELRRLARDRLAGERDEHSFEPTALVHEVYIRLVQSELIEGRTDPKWTGRSHFFGAASEAMRRILVERARRRHTIKHGGGRLRIEMDKVSLAESNDELLAVDEVLSDFESAYPDRAQVVKLRYFVGMTIGETAEAMEISTATVERHWRFAKAWLYAALTDESDDPTLA